MRDALRWLDARWTAVAAVAVVLLVGSALPSPLRRHPAFGWAGPDKLLHLSGHAGFTAVLADALSAGRLDDREAALLAVGVSTGYGFVTNHLQTWVPGRAPERADLVAALLGSMLGGLCWLHGRLTREAPRRWRDASVETGGPGPEPG